MVSKMIGLGDAASVVSSFDAQQYVPPEIQNDINTGAAYYNAFKAGAQQVQFGPNGSVQLSDAAADAIGNTITTTFESSVPILGQALAVFLALSPKAGPGPGTCISQPPIVADPDHPKPSELMAWQFYTPWAKFFEAYNPGDPNSFEAYANAVLQWNWELAANCFGNLWAPPPVLLGALVASWNATHRGPTRTIARTGLNNTGWGLPPGYDPIANALEAAVIAKGTPHPSASSAPPTWAQTEAQNAALPSNVTSSFTINDGPEIGTVKTVVLHLGPSPSPNAPMMQTSPPPSNSPMSTGSKVAISAVVVVGSAAAGVGIWAFVTKQAYGEALSRIWRKSGGKLFR
jgi:hypothetical protein